jgi:hypothetical protein
MVDRTRSYKKSLAQFDSTHYLSFPEHQRIGECQWHRLAQPHHLQQPRFHPDALILTVIAAVFIVLLLMGEAALFAHAVKTIPDFLSQAVVQVP